MSAIRIAIVGVGKIARDQHIPAIAANPDFDLVAGVRDSPREGVPAFPTIAAMAESLPDVEAVSLSTPPQVRHALAREAIDRGYHVMLEKPPGMTLSEVEDLVAAARARGVALFAGWHSRMAPAVEPARAWLADRTLRSVRVSWKEDVRHWHPGQEWIFEAGGLGVFDPGINALSIVSRVLPQAMFLTSAMLSFPANRAAPIAADLVFTDTAGLDIQATLDFRQTGPQSWDIVINTDGGALVLSSGGVKLQLDGRTLVDEPEREYPGLYARFAELVRAREIDVDLAPLRHVADAFMLGRRLTVEPFAF